MNLCFHGGTHAAQTLAEAARRRGFKITAEPHADIVFMSQDTPTDKEGRRDTQSIRANILEVAHRFKGPIVVTSQVEPGFMRALDMVLRNRDYYIQTRRSSDINYICYNIS